MKGLRMGLWFRGDAGQVHRHADVHMFMFARVHTHTQTHLPQKEQKELWTWDPELSFWGPSPHTFGVGVGTR